MSNIVATITDIQNIQNLNIVQFDFCGLNIKMMSLDLNSNVKIGSKVSLKVKPTHISIAKDFTGLLSLSNQLKAKVVDIENGELLSSISLEVKDIVLQSVITLTSTQRMNLAIDDDVTILIKASDISIREVLDV